MQYIAFTHPIGFCCSRATPVVEMEIVFLLSWNHLNSCWRFSIFGILLKLLGEGKAERKEKFVFSLRFFSSCKFPSSPQDVSYWWGFFIKTLYLQNKPNWNMIWMDSYWQEEPNHFFFMTCYNPRSQNQDLYLFTIFVFNYASLTLLQFRVSPCRQ